MKDNIKIIRSKTYNFLRWTEKWTKTDMIYLTKGGFWLTFGSGISTLISLILSLVFANFIPKETYGLYKYTLSILAILAIPTLTGMNTAVTQAIAKEHDGIFFPALKIKIKWGIFGFIGGILLSLYYYSQQNYDLSLILAIASLFLPFMDSFSLYNSILAGKKLFKTSIKYNTIIQIIATLFIIFSIFIFKEALYIVIAYLLSYTILRFIFLKISTKKFIKNDIQDDKSINLGKHLSFIGILSAISLNLDSILIWHYLGPASVAIYSFALAPINPIKSLYKSILNISIPKIAIQEKKLIKKTLPQKVLKSIFIISIPTILYIFALPYLFDIFFPQYVESVKYAQLIALSLLLFPEKLFGIPLVPHSDKKIINPKTLFLPY